MNNRKKHRHGTNPAANVLRVKYVIVLRSRIT